MKKVRFLVINNSYTGDEGYLVEGKVMWSNPLFAKLWVRELYFVKLTKPMESMGVRGKFSFQIASAVDVRKDSSLFYYCRATAIPLTLAQYTDLKKRHGL
jgi:hypothetical protein